MLPHLYAVVGAAELELSRNAVLRRRAASKSLQLT